MAKVFSDYGDVAATRKAADDRADEALTASTGGFMVPDALKMVDALRLEIRAAAQTISSAIGAAIEEWRGETRGQR